MSDHSLGITDDLEAHLLVAKAVRRLIVEFWSWRFFNEREAWAAVVDLVASPKLVRSLLHRFVNMGHLQRVDSLYCVCQEKYSVQLIAMTEGVVLSESFAEVLVAYVRTYRGAAYRVLRILRDTMHPTAQWSVSSACSFEQICEALGIPESQVCSWHIDRVIEAVATQHPSALLLQSGEQRVRYRCVMDHPAYREPPTFIPRDDDETIARIASTIVAAAREITLSLFDDAGAVEVLRGAGEKLSKTTRG